MMQLAMFDGLSERNRILAHMAENHRLYLVTLRSFAREIALRCGTVSIDDVRALMTERDYPMPQEIKADNRILGAVFSSKEFVPVRQMVTTRKERVARSGRGASFITVYELRSAADTLGSTSAEVVAK